jgi:hypothetical protein
LLAVALVALSGTAPAGATTLTLGLDVEFSGGTAPSGTAPWIAATFDDSFGGPNTVRLTMEADNLVGTENVKGWYFNLDPSLNPTLLTFAVVGTPGSTPNSIGKGVDAFKADGDGFFDILFDFPPPPGSAAARFTAGETVVYDITYTGPLDASDFSFPSVNGGGNGVFLSAAHVQQTGGGSGSGFIGIVPEPGTAALLALGLAGVVGARRRSA